MRVGGWLTVSCAGLVLVATVGPAYVLDSSSTRLYPWAPVEDGAISFFLDDEASNLVFDYIHVSNAWAKQDWATLDGAASGVALDDSEPVRVHWVVQPWTTVMMTYTATLRAGAVTLGSAEGTFVLVPGVNNAVDLDVALSADSVSAGAKMTLTLERQVTPTVNGFQAFFVSERLHLSWVEFPVA